MVKGYLSNFSAMLKASFLFVIVFLISLNSFSQADFRSGYIIEISGDTVYGTIDYRGDLYMCTTCSFKTIGSDENVVYAPGEIEAFRFIDSKYFVSKEYKGKAYFMEYLVNGKMDVYYLRDENKDRYFVEKEDAPLAEMPYEEEIRMEDGKSYFYTTTKHIGVLNIYTSDAKQMQNRIQSIKKPDHQSLIKVAEEYHNIVCDGEKCIVYEKKLPKVKVSMSVFGGVINYLQSNDRSNFGNVGMHFYIWSPQSNEKIYFKTGIEYHNLTEKEVSANVYKIPIQLQYIWPKGIFRPMVSAGVNFWRVKGNNIVDFSNSLSINPGFILNINKGLYLLGSINTDFTPITMVMMDDKQKFQMISYSGNLGLYFEF